MACTPSTALQGVTYACDAIVGGIKELYIAYRVGSDVDDAPGLNYLGGYTIDTTVGSTFGQITITSLAEANSPSWGSAASSLPYFQEIQFNTKDGVSIFNDVVTVNADGSKEVVPSILVEIPLMSQANVTAMGVLSQGNVELVAAVRTAADTYHLVGYDFGLYAGTVDGTSGAVRTDKNRIQLTLTGSEAEMAYTFASKADFDAFVGFVSTT